MLSDRQWAIDWFWKLGLNAPSGAQCFPTGFDGNSVKTQGGKLSQCTFWCSVLSDEFVEQGIHQAPVVSQCTFWCSVLSDHC